MYRLEVKAFIEADLQILEFKQIFYYLLKFFTS